MKADVLGRSIASEEVRESRTVMRETATGIRAPRCRARDADHAQHRDDAGESNGA
jgi:hypothetical protein